MPSSDSVDAVVSSRPAPAQCGTPAVVRNGSFTAAARELGLPKSVVSENVKALETRCAVRLLERSTRHLRLTESGARVLASARTVEDAVRDLRAGLDEERSAPTGLLRVATTHDLGPLLVVPVAATLVARHPALQIEIVTDDAAHDLIEAGIDLSVRLGKPRDSTYVLKTLATFSEPIVAAPSLAERFGHAVRPRDLQGAPWVRHSLLSGEVMTFLGPRGQKDEVVVSLRAQTNTGLGVRGLLLGGAGLGVLPEYQIADHLRSGALVRLCAPWIWKQATLYAIRPSAKHPRRSVAVFLAALEEQLGRAF